MARQKHETQKRTFEDIAMEILLTLLGIVMIVVVGVIFLPIALFVYLIARMIDWIFGDEKEN